MAEYVLPMPDDDMWPRFSTGDRLIVDTDAELGPGCDVVLREYPIGDPLVCELLSFNDHYWHVRQYGQIARRKVGIRDGWVSRRDAPACHRIISVRYADACCA